MDEIPVKACEKEEGWLDLPLGVGGTRALKSRCARRGGRRGGGESGSLGLSLAREEFASLDWLSHSCRVVAGLRS